MGETTTYNEKELTALIAEGDEKAFFQLFSRYGPLLRSYALRFTRSAADTEEILQDTFVRIWLYRDKITEIDNLNAWIYKVAGRVCLNYLRSRSNEEKRKEHLKYTGTDPTDPYTPAELMQVQEINRVVHTAVNRMSSKRREIYELNRLHGLKPAEIASRLSIPLGTVKNHLSAALKEIRDELTAAGLGIVAMLLLFLKIF